MKKIIIILLAISLIISCSTTQVYKIDNNKKIAGFVIDKKEVPRIAAFFIGAGIASLDWYIYYEINKFAWDR